MVVIHSGDVILDHYPLLGYPPLNKESFLNIKRSETHSKLPLNNVIVYSTPQSINVSQYSKTC